MKSIHQEFSVPFKYSVHFTEHLFDPTNNLLADTATSTMPGPADVLAVIDRGVVEHHPALERQIQEYVEAHDSIKLIADPLVVPGGEEAKNDPVHVQSVHAAIADKGLCRHSFVMAIGGGAVLDMVGYAAATAHRGLRLIRVPTTVLSQNDSAVGVKNSINAFNSKNFLGTFAPPFAVLNDVTFLGTLEDRDWRGGISEAIKVALLKDPDFFEYLAEHASNLAPPTRDMDAMENVIYRCAELHLEHIATSGDPFEEGSSRPLDFGHWAAHRLEYLTDYELRHGEAVAIGLALDCVYSHLEGLLDVASLERILSLFERLDLPIYSENLTSHIDDPEHPDSIFQGLSEFREHLGGELTIMLLEDIGNGREVHAVDHDTYRKAIGQLRQRQSVSA